MKVIRCFLQFVLLVGMVFQFQSHANAPAIPAIKGDKIALVIGNAEYQQNPLVNPTNDARAMADLLRLSGFEVNLLLNAKAGGMRDAVSGLHSKSKSESVNTTLFYYAGHGMQLDWRNFLLGVDAKVSKPKDVQDFSLDLTDVVSLDRGRKAGDTAHHLVVILDACRDNPFRSAINLPQKGLSQLDAPPNTLVAFSTAPGQFALDGEGENSVYTSLLIKELTVPGISVESALKRVRMGVRMASLGQQVPWESTSLEESVYLKPRATGSKNMDLEQLDALIKRQFGEWERIKHSEDIPALAAFLQEYPDGPMNQLAQHKLDNLLAKRVREEARLVAEQQKKLEADRLAVEQRAEQAEKDRLLAEQAQRQKQEAERVAQETRRKAEELRLRQEAELASLRKQQEAERLAAEQLKLEQEAQRRKELEQLATQRRAEAERLAKLEQQRKAEEVAQRQAAEQLALRQKQEAELAEQEELARSASSARAKAEAQAILSATNVERMASPLIQSLLKAAERINVKPITIPAVLPALPTVAPLQLVSTPNFKGAEPLNRQYLVGDKYVYQAHNLLTNLISQQVLLVTRVDESQDLVEYNNGQYTSDLMGNATSTDRGQLGSPRQFYPANLQVGEKWISSFYQQRATGNTQYFKYDVKVVSRESLTVPAGTFDTFKIVAIGTNVAQGHRIERTLWVTPGINTNIATDVKTYSPRGVLEQHDRRELTEYSSKHPRDKITNDLNI